ncbi:hypothetical protein JOD57_003355 [Geodermatophilus bullaregiensis]|uniref:hypothetical protein n=1 Tax=Geodermatophilus bullaregiensis TaxID=1564160 RepID=UPI001958A85B|nr:hypothetical protein [Geodermatophilus bullaregiensis]MBM7807518.1 hypothetical protein [Geodermatophilus bullaregiensis]
MSRLRSEWTPAQVKEHPGATDESPTGARITDRSSSTSTSRAAGRVVTSRAGLVPSGGLQQCGSDP